MLTGRATPHISAELLERLLKALHPIALGVSTNQWHVGYHNCQADFRQLLQQELNAGPLPTIPPDPVPVKGDQRSRWWKR